MQALQTNLVVYPGVLAATVLEEEQVVLLKVLQTGWDEAEVRQLLAHKGHAAAEPFTKPPSASGQ